MSYYSLGIDWCILAALVYALIRDHMPPLAVWHIYVNFTTEPKA